MRLFSVAALLSIAALSACSTDQSAAPSLDITHGPMLGRVGAHQIGVWARTAQPGSFLVRYGTSSDALSSYSDPVETDPNDDNTGWTLITDLESDTEYFYQVVTSKEDGADPLHSGSFRTLRDTADYVDAEINPNGDFNFSFEFACGNNQNPAQGLGPGMPAYNQMLANVKDKVDFAVLNGDWLYEEKRDYAADQWMVQAGVSEAPSVVNFAPTITGVWENYKHYLDSAPNLAEWHREVPSFFTFDDHEILNDVYGAGTAGRKHRRTVFRDIGVEAWYDYLGWSNPELHTQPIRFGRTSYEEGSDVLDDPDADFTRIDLNQVANLHVHWGGDSAGVNINSLDEEEGDPNAGVYDIVEIIDATHLRVSPPFKANGEQSYSIGRRSYSKMRVSNSDIFFLDTRSHRDMHDVSNPQGPGLSMIGMQQEQWLMDEMKNSDAEIFFVFSSVNLTIPHVGGTAGPGGLIANAANKDEAWTVFLEDRERLINFWDSLGKPVFVLTGDLHNSFAIKITDRVWEFASGPHNSRNHKASAEAGRPANGVFDSLGREVEIRWSSYMRDEVPPELNRQPVYTVVQVNNVFNNEIEEGKERWVKFPRPQIVFQYYDGFTGDLLYAESILTE